MTNLRNLLSPPTRDAIVADLAQLIDTTVASQSGLTGMALKSAVTAVKKANADIIPQSLDRFLPQIVEEIEPFWEKYQNAGAADFGSFLASHEDEVLASMLSVGDRYSDKMPNAVQGAYKALRGKAQKIVGPVLPELGAVIEKHAAA